MYTFKTQNHFPSLNVPKIRSFFDGDGLLERHSSNVSVRREHVNRRTSRELNLPGPPVRLEELREERETVTPFSCRNDVKGRESRVRTVLFAFFIFVFKPKPLVEVHRWSERSSDSFTRRRRTCTRLSELSDLLY